MKRWWSKRISIIGFVLVFVITTGFGFEQIQEKENKQRVSWGNIEEMRLIPGGMPIGIYMETDGVLVLSTEKIESVNGMKYEPAKNIVKSGDYIIGINGKEIKCKKDLIAAVNELDSSQVILNIRRTNEEIEVKIKAVEIVKEKFKLGIWVKDNIQGLGTVTYVMEDGSFGALGHGIHDSDTEALLEISDGSVYTTRITGIQKGKKGTPGGLEGVIIYNEFNEIGTIDLNTRNGIFGTIENVEDFCDSQMTMSICEKKDVKLGKATMLCTVGETVEEFDIKIKNVDSYAKDINKEIIIEVVDPNLIKKTGGIVQGCSGSPIIQDGKIVGAVTHVLVNDPTRGYGIFIEDMLENSN